MKKSFIDPIKMNMYLAGILRRDTGLAKFETINKDYKIELERKDAILWYTDNSYKYLCKFKFKNDLGATLFELTLTEIDIFCLLDNIYQYLENNMNEIIIPFNGSTIQSNSYNFIFMRNENVYNNSFLMISEYNSYTQLMMNRIRIEFDEDSILKFVDLIYFTFLIDIDDNVNLNIYDEL